MAKWHIWGWHILFPFNGLNNRNFFSQFWRLEVQEQGVKRAGVWWGLSSWFTDGHLLDVSSYGLSFMRVKEEKNISGISSSPYKLNSLSVRVPPLWPHLSLITLWNSFLQIESHWALGVNTEFGGVGRGTIWSKMCWHWGWIPLLWLPDMSLLAPTRDLSTSQNLCPEPAPDHGSKPWARKQLLTRVSTRGGRKACILGIRERKCRQRHKLPLAVVIACHSGICCPLPWLLEEFPAYLSASSLGSLYSTPSQIRVLFLKCTSLLCLKLLSVGVPGWLRWQSMQLSILGLCVWAPH